MPLREDLDRYRDECIALWRATDDALRADRAFSRGEKLRNEQRNDGLFDELEPELLRFPEDAAARGAWRAGIKRLVRDSGRSGLGATDAYLEGLLSDASFAVTRDFVRTARELDPSIRVEDVFQALRNVWIANSLQLLLGREMELTPAIFAYSMLYPLTDNVLDDRDVAPSTKAGLNRRLGERLRGGAAEPVNGALARLVGMIEEQYPRDAFPGVHASLLAIHEAQIRSLEQQDGRDLDEVALLDVSFAKGGASVLADGYVVAGELDEVAARFCFGYGVLLQLLDDLQDVRADHEVGHRTIFSTRVGNGALDATAARLHGFLARVLEELLPTGQEDMKELIRRNCTFLWLQAIADHADLFGRPFLRAVEAASPVRLSWLRDLTPLAASRSRRIRDRLEARPDVDSVFDLLG